jgi:hypothetical protein
MKITDVGAAYDKQFERVDTPRTDFVAHDSCDPEWNRSINRFGRMLSHAQILERELVAAQAEIVRLKGEAESWEKVFDRTCEHLADAKTNGKKEWAGLTDDEITKLHHEIKTQLMGTYKTEDIYRAIEAKLREKNT